MVLIGEQMVVIVNFMIGGKLNGTVFKAYFVLFFSRIGSTKTNIKNKKSTDENNHLDL